MAGNNIKQNEKKNTEAVEFVRKTLVSLLGQPTDEATIKAAARKVVRMLPRDSRTQAA
jgi:hypothetical protein